MAEASEPSTLAGGVARIWEKFRGTTLDRVGVVEEAVVALLERRLDEPTRRAAEREAHKLAGAVGTFGFAEASRLARLIEVSLTGTAPIPDDTLLELSEWVERLRVELEGQPRIGAGEPEARPAGDTPPDGDRVLLIVTGDHEFSRSLCMEGEGRGMRCLSVRDEQAALQALNTGSVAGMVVHVSDGLSPEAALALMERLRAVGPAHPVLGLWPEDSPETRIAAARAGATSLLHAPVRPDEVLAALRLEPANRPDVRPRVLALHHDTAVLDRLRQALRPALEVAVLSDDAHVWKLLEQHSPDLLVLGGNPSRSDSLTLLRAVRGHPRWAQLPSIVITAGAGASRAADAFAAGADDVVDENADPAELCARARARVNRARAAHREEDASGPAGASSELRGREAAERLLCLASRAGRPASVALLRAMPADPSAPRGRADAGFLRRLAQAAGSALSPGDVLSAWQDDSILVAMFGEPKDAAARRLEDACAALRPDSAAETGRSPRPHLRGGVAELRVDGSDLGGLVAAAAAASLNSSLSARAVVPAGWAVGAEEAGEIDVLLVEDDVVLGELLIHSLQIAGYTVLWLTNGAEALESLQGSPPAVRARLILLDVDLPGRDGLSVLHALNAAGVTARSRIVMLTARSTEQEVMRALDAGAADHVAKPFSVPVLLQRISAVLRPREA